MNAVREGGVAMLLILAVSSAWLAALAVIRLPRALDRLHAVSFLNAAAGGLIAAAALVADGVSGRSLKILAMTVLLVAGGAVLTHAAGRAVLMREGRQEGEHADPAADDRSGSANAGKGQAA